MDWFRSGAAGSSRRQNNKRCHIFTKQKKARMDANSDRQLLTERHDRAHIFLFMGARPQKRITYTDRWYKYPKFGSEAFIYNVLNFVLVILTLQLRRVGTFGITIPLQTGISRWVEKVLCCRGQSLANHKGLYHNDISSTLKRVYFSIALFALHS